MAAFSVHLREPLKIPVENVQSPPPHLRAREIDDDHVEEIVKAIDKYGFNPLHFHLQILIIDDELYRAVQDFESREAPFQQSDFFDHLDRGLECYAIVGDHSKEAMKRLHEQYPEDVHYAELPMEKLFVIPTNRVESMANDIRGYGDLDNRQSAVHKKMDTNDVVLSMRQMWLQLKDSKNWTEALREVQSLFSPLLTGSSSATNIRYYFTMATLDDECFGYMYTILSGKVPVTLKGKQTFRKKVNQGAWFVPGPKLPRDFMCSLLKRCAQGEITTKDFTELAQIALTKDKIIQAILERFRAKDRKHGATFHTPEDVIKIHPTYLQEFNAMFFQVNCAKGVCWKDHNSPNLKPVMDEINRKVDATLARGS